MSAILTPDEVKNLTETEFESCRKLLRLKAWDAFNHAFRTKFPDDLGHWVVAFPLASDGLARFPPRAHYAVIKSVVSDLEAKGWKVVRHSYNEGLQQTVVDFKDEIPVAFPATPSSN